MSQLRKSSRLVSQIPFRTQGSQIIPAGDIGNTFGPNLTLVRRLRTVRSRSDEADSVDYEESSSWSPDGRTIAFDAAHGGVFEVYLVEVDGSNVRRLTRTSGPRGSESPDWSPDGRQLVFHSDREGKSELYVMDRTGSNVRRLTHTRGVAVTRQGRWSGAGRQIIFLSDRDGNWMTNREIYTMDADGSNVRRLTFNEHRDNHPDW